MLRNGILSGDDERIIIHNALTKRGFTEAPGLWTPTWSPWKTSKWEPFGLKLDWFMVKCLKIVHVAMGNYISDHRALEARLSLETSMAKNIHTGGDVARY